MISSKVVLTYKRKRLSSQPDPADVSQEINSASKTPRRMPSTGLSHKAEPGSAIFHERQEGNDAHFVKCVVCNVEGSLLGCDSCSGTYHLQCADPPLKYIPQGKWRCSACNEQHDDGEYAQQLVQESNRLWTYRSIEGSEMGPIKLCSHKILPMFNLDEKNSTKAGSSGEDASFTKKSDSICMEYPNANSVSANEIPCTKERSGSQLLDWDIVETPSHACLDSSTEIMCNSVCREDSISKKFLSGKNDLPLEEKTDLLCSDMVRKEKFGTPLITFCRRAKRRKDVGDTNIQNNSKLVGDKGTEFDRSNSALVVIDKYEGPTDQSTDTSALRKYIELGSLSASGKDMAGNVEGDADLESSLPEGLLETKMSEGLPLHRTERSNFGHQLSVHSKSTEYIQEEPLVEFRATCSSNDSMKDSSSEVKHEDKQSNSPNIGTSTREEPEIRLADGIEKPVGVSILDGVSQTQKPLSNLDPSVTLSTVTSLCNLSSNKPTTDVPDENLLHSQNSSNCAVEEANERRGKGLEWLATIETQKERMMSSSIQEVDINCGQAVNEKDTSMISSVPNWSEHVSLGIQDNLILGSSKESSNHTVPFQGRMRKPGDSVSENQQGTHTNRTFVCTDFLGLSPTRPETTVDFIKDFQSIPSLSSFSVEGTGYDPWRTSDENSSLLRHKQVHDDFLTGSRMLRRRQGYSLAKFRRYPSVWPEEELDSLWIGVRRHGRGNWNAMLRDPKLHFSGWRLAEDLAERWDMEQSKILSAPLIQPTRLSEPELLPSSITSDTLVTKSAVGRCHGGYGTYPRCSEFETFTGLSLGDVYCKKEEKALNGNSLQLSDLGTVDQLATNDSLRTGSSYHFKGYSRCSYSPKAGTRHQKPIKSQKTDYTLGQSILQQKSVERSPIRGQQTAGLPASTNLPHWIKVVLGAPPTSSEPPLLPGSSSATKHSVSLIYNDQRVIPPFSYPGEQPVPPKDLQRGILKRIVKCGNNAGSLKASNMSDTASKPGMGERVDHLPPLGSTTMKPASENKLTDPIILDLNRISSDLVERNDRVIVDSSEASSEETISDDGGRR